MAYIPQNSESIVSPSLKLIQVSRIHLVIYKNILYHLNVLVNIPVSLKPIQGLNKNELQSGPFLPISRGRISAPFPIKNSHPFSQYHV